MSPRIDTTKGLDSSSRLDIIRAIILLGLMSAVIFHFYIMELLMHQTYPRTTFLFRPDDMFMDFFNIMKGCAHADPYNLENISFMGGYLPTAYLIGYCLSLTPVWEQTLIALTLCFLSILFVTNYYFVKFQKRHILDLLATTAILTFFVYPVLYVVDRGNMDMLMFLLTLIFLVLYQRGYPMLSTFFLALSIAMKVYTGIFILLFLADKRIKETVFTGLLVVAMTIASLACFGEGGFADSLTKFLISSNQAYSIGINQGYVLSFSSSLFTFLYVVLKGWGISINTMPLFVKSYSVLTLLTTAGLLFYFLRIEKTYWRRVFLLVLALILFPYSSGDYRLIFLLFPVWLYIHAEGRSPLDIWYATLLGASLIPKAYVTFDPDLYGRSDLNVNMLINPIILIVLGIMLLLEGLGRLPRSKENRNNLIDPAELAKRNVM